jgi:hypothetical protein
VHDIIARLQCAAATWPPPPPNLTALIAAADAAYATYRPYAEAESVAYGRLTDLLRGAGYGADDLCDPGAVARLLAGPFRPAAPRPHTKWVDPSDWRQQAPSPAPAPAKWPRDILQAAALWRQAAEVAAPHRATHRAALDATYAAIVDHPATVWLDSIESLDEWRLAEAGWPIDPVGLLLRLTRGGER